MGLDLWLHRSGSSGGFLAAGVSEECPFAGWRLPLLSRLLLPRRSRFALVIQLRSCACLSNSLREAARDRGIRKVLGLCRFAVVDLCRRGEIGAYVVSIG